MKKIPVNNGRFEALVDEEDFEKLIQYKWYVAGSRQQYACRQFQKKRIKHYVYMHREIVQAPEGMIVDHINGNTLDNRKDNLRVCTISENAHNSKKPVNNTSGYKGVHYYKSRNKYTAKIMVNRKEYNLGYFNTAEEASAAYRAAAKIYHGEFARYE